MLLLAHRLGMSKIKWELEDLCFRYLHEEEYYDLVNQYCRKKSRTEKFILQRYIEDLNEKLEECME